MFTGTCCTEDGVVKYQCISCGKSNGNGDRTDYHSSTSWGNYVKEITESSLLNNHYVHGGYCYRCHKVEYVDIALHGDLVLTEDIFIYADNINIDLNGYTLDLNGYNFIVYAFGGSDIEIYDSAMEGDYNVVNSSNQDSYLVLFTDHNFSGYAEILLGSSIAMAENVKYYLDDAANLKTIEQLFYEETRTSLDGFHTVS